MVSLNTAHHVTVAPGGQLCLPRWDVATPAPLSVSQAPEQGYIALDIATVAI